MWKIFKGVQSGRCFIRALTGTREHCSCRIAHRSVRACRNKSLLRPGLTPFPHPTIRGCFASWTALLLLCERGGWRKSVWAQIVVIPSCYTHSSPAVNIQVLCRFSHLSCAQVETACTKHAWTAAGGSVPMPCSSPGNPFPLWQFQQSTDLPKSVWWMKSYTTTTTTPFFPTLVIFVCQA